MKRRFCRIAAGILSIYLCAATFFARELVPVGRVIGLELSAGTVTVAAFDDSFTCAREAGLQIGDALVSIDGTPIRSASDGIALQLPDRDPVTVSNMVTVMESLT